MGWFRRGDVVFGALGVLVLVSFGCGGGGGGGDRPQRLAFYTSTKGSGAMATWPEVASIGLTGTAAADAVCQVRAAAAGQDGTFVAWLSDDFDDAYCRVHGLTGRKSDNCGQSLLPASAGPWFRTDGQPFAGRIDDMTDSGVVYHPMKTDEFGNVLDNHDHYWTGTDEAGAAAANNCNNWMDTGMSGPMVPLGATYGTVEWYTDVVSGAVCWQHFHLLCLEAGADNARPRPAASGRTVFVSSATGSGNLGSWPLAGFATGIAAGDAICRGLAAAAGLPNSGRYEAWLSDSTVDAKDRLDNDGPWVRLDGVQVAASTSALLNSWLDAPISVTEEGDYIRASVWTGTNGNGFGGGSLCSDWTSGGGVNGAIGDSAQADDTGWSGTTISNCGGTFRLYCFED